MRILVVDDERPLRDVLRRALTLAGYEVRLAVDGLEGLAEADHAAPDAVVLDTDGLSVDAVLARLKELAHERGLLT